MQGRLMLKVAEIKQLLERLMLKVLKKTKERQQKKRQTKMRPIFKSGSCQGGIKLNKQKNSIQKQQEIPSSLKKKTVSLSGMGISLASLTNRKK